MGMFGFDDSFAMFDVTPVDNQFILDYMTTAKGDFVKVYLYGLLHCYHESEDMCVTQIAKALAMTDDEVMQAFRHWERKGLVRRISDKPPSFRYVNLKQQMIMGTAAERDPAYDAFSESLYAVFGNDRRLHGKEISMAFEWVEEMGLKPEVVLMLIRHMMMLHGKNFSFASAQKLAVMLAEQHALTAEDAELVLTRDRQAWEGSRKLIRRMGKHRDPSLDEMNLYLKWVRDWGYTPDAIEAACAETTKGEPTFAYLDGILRGMMQRRGKVARSGSEVHQQRQEERERIQPLKEVFQALKSREIINDGTLSVYDEMREMYPHEIIMIAARACARYSGNLEDVVNVLRNWKRLNLQSAEQIEQYMSAVNRLNAQLNVMYQLWGVGTRTNAADRALLQKWQESLGYSGDFIIFCAAFANGADKPMLYLDKLLQAFHQQGITTEEAAAAAQKAFREEKKTKRPNRKTVSEQQYEQRDYKPSSELPDWMKASMEVVDNDHHG